LFPEQTCLATLQLLFLVLDQLAVVHHFHKISQAQYRASLFESKADLHRDEEGGEWILRENRARKRVSAAEQKLGAIVHELTTFLGMLTHIWFEDHGSPHVVENAPQGVICLYYQQVIPPFFVVSCLRPQL